MTFSGFSLIISVLLVLFLWFPKYALGYEDAVKMPSRPIEEVLKEHTEELMSVPGVVGTAQGICNSRPCIKVFVVEKTKEIDKRIPDELDGYPVEVEETGEFKVLPEDGK